MPLACVGDSERQCMKDTYQKASYKHCYYDYDPYIYSQRGGEVGCSSCLQLPHHIPPTPSLAQLISTATTMDSSCSPSTSSILPELTYMSSYFLPQGCL